MRLLQQGSAIGLLAGLAALFHDFGKASDAFQKKLANAAKTTTRKADPYRHEWVSLRLFLAFVAQHRTAGKPEETDRGWLTSLAQSNLPETAALLKTLVRDGIDRRPAYPFDSLPPLAAAVAWLMVSHHRLPTQSNMPVTAAALAMQPEKIDAAWCGGRRESHGGGGGDNTTIPPAITACWQFSKGLPLDSSAWRAQAARIAQTCLHTPSFWQGQRIVQDQPALLHVARMALMLADHYYSGQPALARHGTGRYPLYANTDAMGKRKQRLDEHLIGVAIHARRIGRALPLWQSRQPALPAPACFRSPPDNPRFLWQETAARVAAQCREASTAQGFFGVNLASTGCGKTLANARIAHALAIPERGARFTLALGLRTLTLQTGAAYRQHLDLQADALAVLVGGGEAVRTLHEWQQAAFTPETERQGSESAAPLLGSMPGSLDYAGPLRQGAFGRWLASHPDAQKLLAAPLLACTIDHLMPATESQRGGHQIAPLLRLLTSDLILDEPDDFSVEDLPALSRLVHWAGLLGSRVLLSSATLPPALVEGLFAAYQAGWQQGQAVEAGAVCCAWFDEFGSTQSHIASPADYASTHAGFVHQRLAALAGAENRRLARLIPLVATGAARETVRPAVARVLQQEALRLHQQHAQPDPASGKRVSFGLIRMANIDPLIDVARHLLHQGSPAGVQVHLCVYHARHPLLIRSAIERQLDRSLQRQQPEAVFALPEIRQALAVSPAADHLFIVLATAVAEVGRDHDYDWAIVEPSSMRSIIQLAGRIRRHRPGACQTPNLSLLETNLRHLESGNGAPAFCQPGFESTAFPLRSHQLSQLLSADQLACINAASRIAERDVLHPESNLVDLEHARLRALMQGEGGNGPARQCSAALWWTTPAPLSGEMQRDSPFRADRGRERCSLTLEDEKLVFRRYASGGSAAIQSLHPLPVTFGPGICLWGQADYAIAIATLAQDLNISPEHCGKCFGTIDLPTGVEQGWAYHPALGFRRME